MAFWKIAHRGASGTRPEHTRAAFLRAVELGVDMIELDVQLTRDRRLVVLHDRILGRTVTGQGAVRDRTFAELRELDAGSWFGSEYADEKVLSLEDVCAIVPRRIAFNVEIKSPAPDWSGTVDLLLAVLRAAGRQSTTIVSCFDVGALACLRAADPSVQIGVLWQSLDLAPLWEAAKELRAVSVHPGWALATPGLVEEAHRLGLQVIAWTANAREVIEMLCTNGVDGVITDFPELFQEPGLGERS